MRFLNSPVFLAALLSLIQSVASGQAQLCDGSLGANIFDEGDFGTGSAVILPDDPGIAPGYTYETRMPIDDGEYTITNNVGLWSSLYPTWLPIQDNSDDPFGYMMVVNASFNPGVFYEEIVDDVCPNTTYEFSADVINMIRPGVADHILPNVSFLIDDAEQYTTGRLQQNERWQTVGFTFQTGPGQNQVKLTLRNNAPGGFGNDLALDNISFKACGPSARVESSTAGTICEDANFPVLSAAVEDLQAGVIQWQISEDGGFNWSDMQGGTIPSFQVEPVPPGNYLYRFVYATSPESLSNPKCRTISDRVELTVVPIEYFVVDTICDGLSYELGGQFYNRTGIYEQRYTSSIGCDSVVILDLTIQPNPGFIPEYRIESPSCAAFDDGVIAVEQVSGAVPPLSMQIIGDTVSYADSIVLPAGDYSVVLSDRYGCSHVADYTILDPERFILKGLADTAIILGDEILLVVEPNYDIDSISWVPTDGLLCDDCISNIVSPVESTVYTVRATNENACIAETIFSVTVRADIGVYTPNVFSPNGDGVNDLWSIGVNTSQVESVELLRIFDRYGGVVFESRDVGIGEQIDLWDGTSGSRMVDPGVYTFILTMRLIDGSELVRGGDISVVK